jgi:uncharacterized lipoprotein YddW (UPF0748 family)
VTQTVTTTTTAETTTTVPETTTTTTVPETTSTTTVPETTTTTTTVPETTTTVPPETTTTTTVTTTTPPPETTTTTTTVATTTTVTEPLILPVTYNTLNYPEQKGVWISYLEYDRLLKGKSKAEFTENINTAFDNVVSIGFNTVYLQLRAFGDAYYSSDYFPQGDKSSGFDPLPIMIKSAHDRGLSVHGWVNPMRLCTEAEMSGLENDIIYKNWYKSGTADIFKHDGRYYLNPDSDNAVNLIISGIAEIMAKYSVDGIQIDDYFYPDGNPSEAKKARVNRLVKAMYNTVHAANPDALFGISPQGNIENNTALSADVREWASNPGYCDYILPQVYYGFDNGYSPYLTMISDWSALCTDVKLIIGLSPYKIGIYDTYATPGNSEWLENSDIIARQMSAAKSLPNYSGVALFRYDSLFNPANSVAQSVNAEVENIKKDAGI